MHWPAVICVASLFIVVPLAVRHYRKRHKHVLRTLLILLVAMHSVYPYVAKNIMFAIMHNTSGSASVNYDRNSVTCQYQQSDMQPLSTTCTFKIFNYGNASSVAITPIIHVPIGYPRMNLMLHPQAVPVIPHHTQTITAVFESDHVESLEQAVFSTNRVSLTISIPN